MFRCNIFFYFSDNCYICVLEHSSIAPMSEYNNEPLDLSSSLPEVWRMLSDIERSQLRENARVMQFKKNELI